MLKQRRGRLATTVELTPLIDIVFLLLIFFMVSTTFIRQNELTMELPQADGASPKVDAAAVRIAVFRDGRYEVNGESVGVADGARLLQALAAVPPAGAGGRVVVTADAQAAHQAVVTALDAAGQAGLTRISIITRPPPASISK